MAKNQMAKMMQQARKMQEQMAAAQELINSREFAGTAGGGMVLAVVGGDLSVKSISIKEEVVDPEDIEMLQDMVVAAVNDGLRQAQDFSNSQMGNFTQGLNIPGMPAGLF